jgi:hypothetical protein
MGSAGASVRAIAGRKEVIGMKNGQATAQQKLQQVRDAAATYLPATSDLQLAGQSVKVPDLLAVLDGALATFAPVNAAKVAVTQAQTARTQKVAAAEQEVAQLKGYLIGIWGKGSPQLAPFGFAAKVKVQPTSEQQALRAAKAKLTRQARGTKGTKQKLGVTAQGQPGLLLVNPDGTPVPGVMKGPSAPGIPPVTAAPAAAPAAQGSAPAASSASSGK